MARLRAQAVERDPSTGTGMHIDNIEEEEEIEDGGTNQGSESPITNEVVLRADDAANGGGGFFIPLKRRVRSILGYDNRVSQVRQENPAPAIPKSTEKSKSDIGTRSSMPTSPSEFYSMAGTSPHRGNEQNGDLSDESTRLNGLSRIAENGPDVERDNGQDLGKRKRKAQPRHLIHSKVEHQDADLSSPKRARISPSSASTKVAIPAADYLADSGSPSDPALWSSSLDRIASSQDDILARLSETPAEVIIHNKPLLGKPTNKQTRRAEGLPDLSSSTIRPYRKTKQKLLPSSQISKQGSRRPVTQAPLQSTMPLEVHSDNSQDPEEGITDIIMDPSPVKPASPLKKPTTALAKLRKRIGDNGHTSPPAPSLPAPHQQTPGVEPHNLIHFIDPADLRDMTTGLERVGHSFNREKKAFVLVHTMKKCYTATGNKVNNILDDLLECYNLSKDSQAARDKIRDQTEELQVKCDRMLGPSVLEKLPDKCLKDLYFIIIPKFMKVVESAVAAAHTSNEEMPVDSLKEILELVDTLYTLSSTARDQPKHKQPEANPKNTYKVSKPVHDFVPQVRDLRDKLSAEIKRREPVPGLARKERFESGGLMDDSETRRLHDEDAAQTRKLKRREIRKKQQKDMEARLADPVWGPLARANLEKEEAKARNGGNRKGFASSQSRRKVAARTDKGFTVDDDNEFSDESYDRVSVFPSGNNHDSFQPWTAKERCLFIGVMRDERGKSRYQIAAEKLNRSVDDVILLAKEFQEVFDQAHKQGRLLDPCDDFTNDVYVEGKQ